MIIESNWGCISPDIYLKSSDQYNPLGIFSNQIFGPEKDYMCNCEKTSGIQNSGKRCAECQTIVGPSTLRRHTVSKIDFPMTIPHPLICLYLLPPQLQTAIQNEKEEVNILIKVEEYFKKESIKFNLIKDKFPMYISSIPVLPPAIRPILKQGTRDMEMDKLNYYYLLLLNQISKYNESLSDEQPTNMKEYTKLSLLRTSMKLYKYIITLLSKKEGMIRQSVLGKRNDFTGRAVITIDPTLRVDQAKIPYRMLAGLWKPKIIYRLSQACDIITSYEKMTKYINNPDSIEKSFRLQIEDVITRLCSHELIYLNRQPTLHRVGIQAFRPLPTHSEAISIAMPVTSSYNADFDGDTMAVYTPLTEKSKEEAENTMLSSRQLLVPGSLSFVGFTQDIILGAYFATKDAEPIVHVLPEEYTYEQILRLHPHTQVTDPKTDIVTSAGRVSIAYLLDLESPLDYTLNKKTLPKLIESVIEKYPDDPDKMTSYIYKVQQYILPFATQFTMSILDYQPQKLEEKKAKYQNVTWNAKQVKSLMQESKTWSKELELSEDISEIVLSGARGNIGQLMQMVGLRGFVKNASGKLILPPILSSLTEGYSPTEMILSAAGNRKGAVDKALNTAVSGYMTRKLVFSLQHILSSDSDDCGTDQGLIVDLTKDNIKTYMYRYVSPIPEKDKKPEWVRINRDNKNDFLDKTWMVASPIHCRDTKGICKLCYPYRDIYKSTRIGFISAQSLGEPTTQLIMRSFHTGGAAEGKTTDLPECILIGEDDICITSSPLTMEPTSDFHMDSEGFIFQDSEVNIAWEDNSTLLMLPRNTQLLINPNKLSKLLPIGTQLFKFVTKHQDLATDLSVVRNMLDSTKAATYKDAIDNMNQLKALYSNYQSILSIHFELLWSERMRTLEGKYTRLNSIYDDTFVKTESLSNIPHSRLLLSLCFENFRKFFKTYLSSTDTTASPLEILIQSDLRQLSTNPNQKVIDDLDCLSDLRNSESL